MQSLIRSKSAGVTGGRGTAGAGPGRDLLYGSRVVRGVWCQALSLPRPPVIWGGQPSTATRVFRVRSVRAWGPSTGPTACAVAGRRCSLWGWRKGVHWAAALHRCEGRLRSGAPPPLTARPLGGLLGSASHVLWARVCGCGGPTLSPWPACPVGAACRGGRGGPSPGGVPATVVRGVRCQALSLPRPPVLWGGRPGFCDPCVPGAVGAGVGTQHRPHSVRPCGPALLAVGVAEQGPRGGAFHRCQGRLRSGAPPPPTARPLVGLLGSATHVLGTRACGCGGQSRSPWPACPVQAACRGGGGAPSPGGVACHRCEGRLVSGAVPPPAAHPLGRAAGVPRPVCPGCGRCGRGTQHRSHSVRPCRPALLAVGVAEGPSTVLRGVCGQALPLPELPAHWAGCWGPPPTCCGRGRVGVGA